MNEYLLPEHIQAGRPYSLSHRLGRVMKARGWEEVYLFAAEVEVSPRVISRYLAGEKIPPHHLYKFSLELDCPGEWLQEEENGGAALPTTQEGNSNGTE